MSEVHVLWILLIGLYLAEGLWWLPYNSVLLEQVGPASRWRFRTTGMWPSTRRRALMCLVPIPGTAAVQVDAPPLSVSPKGLACWHPGAWTGKGRPAQNARSWAWSDIGTIDNADESLRIDGEEAMVFSCAPAARDAADWLERMRVASEERREGVIGDWWRATTDAGAIRARIETGGARASTMRWATFVLWSILFVGLPAITAFLGGVVVLAALGGSAALAVVASVWCFVRWHRIVMPESRWDRIETALVMCLNWPAAARVATTSMRSVLAGFHPLAVVVALAPDRAGAIADRILRDAAHPLAFDHLDDAVKPIVAWYATWRHERIEDLLANAGVTTGPEPSGDLPYCPRCSTEYGIGHETCPDCPGVALVGEAEGGCRHG